MRGKKLDKGDGNIRSSQRGWSELGERVMRRDGVGPRSTEEESGSSSQDRRGNAPDRR